MRVRPIIFSTPMVQALLEGRKTQTRRIVKPQPNGGPQAEMINLGGAWGLLDGILSGEWRCPYGQPGDLLWVRETYRHIELPPHQWDEVGECEIDYRATPRKIFEGCEVPWRPSIHMPRRDSRLTLRITDVRVERVQEISEADALAEGVKRSQRASDARDSYASLWESINGTGSWDANPWVWVIEFQRIQEEK